MGKRSVKKRCYAHPETTLSLMKCRCSVEGLLALKEEVDDDTTSSETRSTRR
jgi:hypothetical protein